jgi:hypothetical protein
LTTGYTRELGNLGAKVAGEYDLTNDHPISVTYDAALANRDGEMRVPDGSQQSTIMVATTHPLFGKRAAGQSANRPVLPLDPTGASSAGQVQCTTCHDPHLKGDATDLANELNIKFLRRPRFQLDQAAVNPQNYNDGNDIICLACHDKGMQGAGGGTWVYSAHANKNVATQTYIAAAAATRQFPANIPVWRVACLNCHDTHTVTGARRLLREGTDAVPGTALYLGGFKAGGSSAIEETCYQCHRDSASSIITPMTSVPDIRSDFQLTYRMPITLTDQFASAEAHDVGSGRTGFNDGYAGGVVNGTATTGSNCSSGTNDKCGADLIEPRALLGTTASNRHVECPDCHNPHRVVKFKLFFGNAGNLSGAGDAQGGTHEHRQDIVHTHTNVASGVLRGTWGVEPIYGSTAASRSFHAGATDYKVRRGDPGTEVVSTAMPLTNANMDTVGFVTREYQVCLKCHSTYGFTSPPNLRTSGSERGLTPAGSVATPGVGNALTQYTDQAKEFQSPDNHATGGGDNNHDGTADAGYPAVNLGTEAGSAGGYNANNHRSWHPVMRSTGRTTNHRGMGALTTGWRAPFNNAIGTQTMYCTDCHGSNTTGGGTTPATGANTVIPDNTNSTTGAGNAWGPHGSGNPFILKGTWNKDVNETSAICMKCHNPNGGATGFYDAVRGKANLHAYHITKIGSIQCTWCHVAVPHGWKNKMFLVNLNDVGEEAGQGVGSSKEVRINANGDYYTAAPYYLEAKLKIKAFSPSGGWDYANCGSSNKTGVNLIPSSNGNSTTNHTGQDRTWMLAVCGSTTP